MKKNVGIFDKGLRFFLCTLCVYYSYKLEPRSGINGLLILIAFYLFISALGGYCLIYKWFKWDTQEKKNSDKSE
jgi:hypothetical protein